ncbi:MAG TPA: NTP transferase domain-containing protein [Spirochaetota bacterium]|nr:NTP transferase domain-containing protein [Spirochaetota bacterium]
MNNCKAVILAAGKGVRMQSSLPKVLHSLAGKPLIQHVIDNLVRAGISHNNIIVVVGYKGDDVITAIDNNISFVWQREQLGTGHAVMQTEPQLGTYNGCLLVACGDVPLIKPETFIKLCNAVNDHKTGAAVLTMELENPYGYGRIIRGEYDNLIRIVEEKDADTIQRNIKEVNTGTYAFRSPILFQGLKTITTDNAQREYYLPDVLPFIRKSGYDVKIIKLDDSIEGTGVNSKEELIKLEGIIRKTLIKQ